VRGRETIIGEFFERSLSPLLLSAPPGYFGKGREGNAQIVVITNQAVEQRYRKLKWRLKFDRK